MIRLDRGVTAALVALLFAGIPTTAAQDWRDSFVSSFDVIWETVRDTHFDPALGGVNWDAVRTELRPRVTAATEPAAARNILRQMLERIGQSHFSLMTAAENESETPLGEATVLIDVRATADGVFVTRVVPASAAGRAGVRAGDRLVAIDDIKVQAAVASDSKPPADNAIAAWLHVVRDLSGKAGSTAKLRLVRPDRTELIVEVVREIEPGEPVTLGNLPTMRANLEADEVRTPSGKRVGVIAFNVWMAPLAEPFAAAIDRFRAADGLVIDLSGNVGGIVEMIRGVAGHLVNEPLVLGRMQMRSNTLEFRANPRRATSDGRRVVPFAGPVAIVVDGLTASASECFAAGLQGLGRARVFGTQTMGQALPALTRSLPNGDVFMYAVGDFVTAGGGRVEGVGVIPDEVVPIDPAALAAGRDARDRALAWIDRSATR